jgi:hypothetical protein
MKGVQGYLLSNDSVLFLSQFKKGDIFFNYGCFPQTWEDPTYVHPDAEGCRGDNDPVDVCEIGARIVKPGVSVFRVKEMYFIILWEKRSPFFGCVAGCAPGESSWYPDDDR